MTPTSRRSAAWAWLAAAALIAACANLNPVAVAETPEQRYNAAKLAYDALLTPAIEIIEDPAAPIGVRRTLQELVGTSGELYRAGNAVYADYRAARAAVAAGESPQDRLDIATANLERWAAELNEAVDLIATAIP